MSDRDPFDHSSETDPLAPQWASPNGEQPSSSSSPFPPAAPGVGEAPSASYPTPSAYAQPPAPQPSPYGQPSPMGQPGIPQGAPGYYQAPSAAPYGQPVPPPGTPYVAPGASAWNQSAYAQPGIIPLRPLLVSDLFEGMFKAIRSNPSVMFGFTMTVMTLVGLLAAVISYFVPTQNVVESLVKSRELGLDYDTAQAITNQVSSSLVLTLISLVALHIVSGILSTTVSDAVIGRKTDLPSAWGRVKGRVLTLILSSLVMMVLMFVWVIVMTIAYALIMVPITQTGSEGFAATVFLLLLFPYLFFTFLYLPVRFIYVAQSIVLERQGVFASMGRSWKLTRKSFWSTVGRYLLIIIVSGMIQAAVSMFVGIILGLVQSFVPLTFMPTIELFISSLLQGLVLPLSAAYLTLMYIDRRIRLEGLADSLLKASQS